MPDVGRIVAGLPGVHAAVVKAATVILENARINALGHGNLAAHLNLEYPNRYDVNVTLRHVAALSIEEGHWDEVFHSGYVPGLHVLRDAVAGS